MQVSYAIGVAEPLSIFISSYGTGIKSDADLLKIVKANFDLRPGKIVKFVFYFTFYYLCPPDIASQCSEANGPKTEQCQSVKTGDPHCWQLNLFQR